MTASPQDCEIAVAAGCRRVAKVYLVNQEDRLEMREVEVGMIQAEFVVVSQGLVGGEQLVISDLIPASRGMLLKPVEDETARTRLIQVATAEGHRP